MSLNVYEIITQRIIDSLEKGCVPWKVPWTSHAPCNLISKKPYRGINVFLTRAMNYPSPYFLTYKQCQGLGGQVIRGSKSTPIVFWKSFEKAPTLSLSGRTERGAILRYFSVFNLTQCEGIEAPMEDTTLDFQPKESCEQIVAPYAAAGPSLQEGDRACYTPSTDTITMPPRQTFESEDSFYATLYHEMIHSSGHASRLNRKGITQLDSFGSHQYSEEELVAEMGSAFLCGESGIINNTIEASASYIQSWVQRLHDNSKWVISASGAAQKAADMILGRSPADNGGNKERQ